MKSTTWFYSNEAQIIFKGKTSFKSWNAKGWFSHSFRKLFINSNNTQESIFLRCLQPLNLPKFSLNYFNNSLMQSYYTPNKWWNAFFSSLFFPQFFSRTASTYWETFIIKTWKQMHWAQSSFVDQCGDRCMNPVFRLGMLQRKVMQLLSHSLVSFCHEVLPAGSQMEPTQPHTGTRLKEVTDVQLHWDKSAATGDRAEWEHRTGFGNLSGSCCAALGQQKAPLFKCLP